MSSISGACGHVRDPQQQQDVKLALLMLFVLPREAAAYKVPHLHDAVVSASFLSWWRARGYRGHMSICRAHVYDCMHGSRELQQGDHRMRTKYMDTCARFWTVAGLLLVRWCEKRLMLHERQWCALCCRACSHIQCAVCV